MQYLAICNKQYAIMYILKALFQPNEVKTDLKDTKYDKQAMIKRSNNDNDGF